MTNEAAIIEYEFKVGRRKGWPCRVQVRAKVLIEHDPSLPEDEQYYGYGVEPGGICACAETRGKVAAAFKKCLGYVIEDMIDESNSPEELLSKLSGIFRPNEDYAKMWDEAFTENCLKLEKGAL